MFKDIVLENSRRKQIYKLIRRNPGLHLRELQRRLGIPLSSLEHHVDYMIRKDVLYRQRDGRYTRYFSRQLTEDERQLISVLRHEKLREIVSIVLEEKKVKFQDLVDYLDLPSSTLSYYLKHLVDHHVLSREKVGYDTVYSVQDKRVERVILIYEPGLTDKLVDKVMSAFLETDFRNVDRRIMRE